MQTLCVRQQRLQITGQSILRMKRDVYKRQQHKCLIDTFDRNFEYSVEHVTLAKWADIVMIAPATANVIGKLAHGIADDMLTTTVMACAECKNCLLYPSRCV